MTRIARGELILSMVLCLFIGYLAGQIMQQDSSQAGSQPRSLRYREVGNDGPTIVIRGRGCLQAEDSMFIRHGFDLVGDGEPGMTRNDLVVYRCVQP
jgi:hypothetical protein